MNLRKDPMPHDSSKLHGTEDQYRVDIGEYRIVYKFDDKTVYIQIVGKRNDDEVYKKMKK
jgi:mRNA interferase RelE/StbE